MKRSGFLLIISLLLSILLFSKDSDAAVMEDYCVVPPYVIQNVPPNVMIVLDNSGSMFYFSYFDGFTTTITSDDNLCATIGSPCTGFTTPALTRHTNITDILTLTTGIPIQAIGSSLHPLS